tara:strand:+ start:319 stop:501 length:183 start_codon:yes stop_codon:yes gene_type:complete
MGIITYLILGTIFTMIVDICSYLFDVQTFNALERIICVVLWPITFTVFIYAAFKEFFKRK